MAGPFDNLMKPINPLKPATTDDQAVLESIALSKAKPGMSASQQEAEVIKAQGARDLQGMQKEIQKGAALGEQALISQQQALQKEETARSIALQRLADKNEERLAQLGGDAARQIQDESRQFRVDSANRKYMNQAMLDQYAAEELLDSESTQNYIQNKELMMNRKIQLMDAYANKIRQVLEQGYLKEKGDLDQASKETLTRLAAAYQQKKADAMKKAQKSSMLKQVITGAFSAAGAVAGGIYGGPAGAAVGATAGGALGGVAGAAVSENVVE